MNRLIILLATFILIFPSYASSNCENARKLIKTYEVKKKELEDKLDANGKEIEQEKNKLPANSSKREEWKRIYEERKIEHERLKIECDKATEYYSQAIGNPLMETPALTDMRTKCGKKTVAKESLDESDKELRKYEGAITEINSRIRGLENERKDIFSEILKLLNDIPAVVDESDERAFYGTPNEVPKFEREFETEVMRKAAERAKTQIESETIVEKGKLKKDLIKVTVNDTPLCTEPDEPDPNKRWHPPSPGRPSSWKYKYKAKYIFFGQMALKESENSEKPKKEPDISKPPPLEPTFEEKAKNMLKEKYSYNRRNAYYASDENYKNNKSSFEITIADEDIYIKEKTFIISTKIKAYEKEGWEYGHLAPLVKDIKIWGKISEDGTKIEEKYFYIKTEPYPFKKEPLIYTIMAGVVTGLIYYAEDYNAKEKWKQYNETTNPTIKEDYKKKAQDHENARNILTGIGIGVTTLFAIATYNVNKDWGRTEWWLGPLVSPTDKKDNPPISMNIIPQSDGGVVLFSYAF